VAHAGRAELTGGAKSGVVCGVGVALALRAVGVAFALVLRALSFRSNGSNAPVAHPRLCKRAGHIMRWWLAALGGAGLDPLDLLDPLDEALSRMC